MSTIVGLDLGQRNDFTAAVVVEKVAERVVDPDATAVALSAARRGLPVPSGVAWATTYAVRRLDRTRQVAYSTVADNVAALLRTLPGAELVVDETGVGAGVVDLLKERGLTPIPVTIHGGDTVFKTDGGFRVPKRDLASAVGLVLEQRRLTVPAALPHAETLRAELAGFRVKVSLAGHDAYGAGGEWREGQHDDLVLALALAVWYGERDTGPGYTPTLPSWARGDDDERPYNAYDPWRE